MSPLEPYATARSRMSSPSKYEATENRGGDATGTEDGVSENVPSPLPSIITISFELALVMIISSAPSRSRSSAYTLSVGSDVNVASPLPKWIETLSKMLFAINMSTLPSRSTSPISMSAPPESAVITKYGMLSKSPVSNPR